MNIPFVDLNAQYDSIRDQVGAAMQHVIDRSAFILGDEVAQFENAFAEFCGVAHGVGVDSGTTALELALRAHGIGPGDEVITTANTFIATVLAISYCGATPVLVDVDPDTYQMRIDLAEQAITGRTRAIIPVHLYGHPVDMDGIKRLADQYDLIVVEDASQAHAARHRGQRVGSFGDSAAFSLYPAKNLGAYGDAGIVVTNDADLAARLRLLRNYGSVKKYHHQSIGYNHRLDTIQAAVLCAKLPHLQQWTEARQRNARLYDELLAGSGVELPATAEHAEPVYHLYVVRSERRDELQAYLREQGIATGIHYPIPVHLQPAYRSLDYTLGDFPVTEAHARQILSLPMYPELERAQIEYVADAIHRFNAESIEQQYAPLAAV